MTADCGNAPAILASDYRVDPERMALDKEAIWQSGGIDIMIPQDSFQLCRGKRCVVLPGGLAIQYHFIWIAYRLEISVIEQQWLACMIQAEALDSHYI